MKTTEERIKRIVTDYTDGKLNKEILIVELEALVLSAKLETIKELK